MSCRVFCVSNFNWLTVLLLEIFFLGDTETVAQYSMSAIISQVGMAQNGTNNDIDEGLYSRQL